MGTALANLVTLLNPSCLVIEEVARHRPTLIGALQDRINEIAVPPAVKVSQVEVVAARLEPEAEPGMYGNVW